MSWWLLVEDLLDHLDLHPEMEDVSVRLGPSIEAPERGPLPRVELIRGTHTGDPTQNGVERTQQVFAECFAAVPDDDWRGGHAALDDVERRLFAALRAWRLSPERFADLRYQASVGDTQPDQGAFAPAAIASRTPITIQYTPRRPRP